MIKLLLVFMSGGAINLLSSELYIYSGRWSDLIVRWAASKMPVDLQDRFEEEWAGVLNETPGNLAKLRFSLGCCIAALRTPNELTMNNRSMTHSVLDDGQSVRSIRTRYGFNPTQREVELYVEYMESNHTVGDQWRITGKVIVGDQPISHAILVDRENLIDHYQGELTRHLRAFADAYADGERWEYEQSH